MAECQLQEQDSIENLDCNILLNSVGPLEGN